MAHRRRPPYEDQDARISILANGQSRKAGYVFADCSDQTTQTTCDGAGHTFTMAFVNFVVSSLIRLLPNDPSDAPTASCRHEPGHSERAPRAVSG